jgi:glycosyltransferase-like protein LARGE
MLTSWDGPASVVLHVADAEAQNLTEMIRASPSLRLRRKVAYHVVYKLEPYNPINYLRNVAINNTRTLYVFYVDVDLIPVVSLYTTVRRALSKLTGRTNDNQKVAFVVPSFEAFTVLPELPPNKTELLKLIQGNKIGGYRMKRGWNLGHKPTNYTHWAVATKPYDVTYHDAFEPYVVVRSDNVHRFNERLLERMADKAMYIRALHGAGFKLRVIPDVFLVHLPHAPSPVFALQNKIRGYQRCASVISEEYKAELRSRYPTAKF